jgi:hypothetical protein
MPWPLCPRYPLYMRLSGPQSQSRRFGEEVSPTPIGIRTSGRPARSLSYLTDYAMPDPRYHVRAIIISSLFICGLHKHAASTQKDKPRSGWSCCYFSDISITAVLVLEESTNNNAWQDNTGGRNQTCPCSVLSLLARELRLYNAKWKMLTVSFNKRNSVFCRWMCSYSHVFIRYHKIKTNFARTCNFYLK